MMIQIQSHHSDSYPTNTTKMSLPNRQAHVGYEFFQGDSSPKPLQSSSFKHKVETLPYRIVSWIWTTLVMITRTFSQWIFPNKDILTHSRFAGRFYDSDKARQLTEWGRDLWDTFYKTPKAKSPTHPVFQWSSSEIAAEIVRQQALPLGERSTEDFESADKIRQRLQQETSLAREVFRQLSLTTEDLYLLGRVYRNFLQEMPVASMTDVYTPELLQGLTQVICTKSCPEPLQYLRYWGALTTMAHQGDKNKARQDILQHVSQALNHIEDVNYFSKLIVQIDQKAELYEKIREIYTQNSSHVQTLSDVEGLITLHERKFGPLSLPQQSLIRMSEEDLNQAYQAIAAH